MNMLQKYLISKSYNITCANLICQYLFYLTRVISELLAYEHVLKLISFLPMKIEVTRLHILILS